MDIDQKLYREFLAGNMKSFDKLVDKYRNTLISFITTFIRKNDLAEDLAQDVFVYILMNKKEYDFKFSMKTYLYAIAKSRAINYLNKNKRILYIEDYPTKDIEIYQTEEQFMVNENKRKIHNAIKNLNTNQQRIIYLVDIEDMSYKETAKIMDISIPQVKMTLYRARKKLKDILEKEELKHG